MSAFPMVMRFLEERRKSDSAFVAAHAKNTRAGPSKQTLEVKFRRRRLEQLRLALKVLREYDSGLKKD